MGNCLQTSDSDDVNLVHSNGDDQDDEPSPGPTSIHHADDRPSVLLSRQDEERRSFGAPPSYDNSAIDSRHTLAPMIFHPSPGVSRTACQLTEEEQIKIAQRIGLIQHLPVDIFVEASKTDKECIICMMDFCEGDHVRFLPCLHTFHLACIDDWLMRSFTCPSCLEPVDSALLTSYDQNAVELLSNSGSTGTTLQQQLDTLTSSPVGGCGDRSAVVADQSTTPTVSSASSSSATDGGAAVVATTTVTSSPRSNQNVDEATSEDGAKVGIPSSIDTIASKSTLLSNDGQISKDGATNVADNTAASVADGASAVEADQSTLSNVLASAGGAGVVQAICGSEGGAEVVELSRGSFYIV